MDQVLIQHLDNLYHHFDFSLEEGILLFIYTIFISFKSTPLTYWVVGHLRLLLDHLLSRVHAGR